MTAIGRFLMKVDVQDGCWPWLGCTDAEGYGRFRLDGETCNAHRAAWVLLVGPIAPGLVIDHLCRMRSCVNPAHLEPVPDRVNVARGNGPQALHVAAVAKGARTTCHRGHSLADAYIDRGARRCRPCNLESQRRSWLTRRVLSLPGPG